MLRESFKRDIINSLEKNSGLYGDDFIINDSEVNSGAGSLFNFEYFYNPKFHFKLLLTKEELEVEKSLLGSTKMKSKVEQYVYKCSMCPGTLFENYQIDAHNEEEFWGIFNQWTLRVWEDIQATSIYNKIERIKKDFEKYDEKLEDIANDYFTNEEAQKIINRLTELETKISEHMKDDKINSELEKVKMDIKLLNDEVYSLTKGNWFKKWHVRFMKWIINPNNQKVIIESAANIKQLIEPSNK